MENLNSKFHVEKYIRIQLVAFLEEELFTLEILCQEDILHHGEPELEAIPGEILFLRSGSECLWT